MSKEDKLMIVYEVSPRLAISGTLIGTMGGSFDFSVTAVEDSVCFFEFFPESRDVDQRRFLIPRRRFLIPR